MANPGGDPVMGAMASFQNLLPHIQQGMVDILRKYRRLVNPTADKDELIAYGRKKLRACVERYQLQAMQTPQVDIPGIGSVPLTLRTLESFRTPSYPSPRWIPEDLPSTPTGAYAYEYESHKTPPTTPEHLIYYRDFGSNYGDSDGREDREGPEDREYIEDGDYREERSEPSEPEEPAERDSLLEDWIDSTPEGEHYTSSSPGQSPPAGGPRTLSPIPYRSPFAPGPSSSIVHPDLMQPDYLRAPLNLVPPGDDPNTTYMSPGGTLYYDTTSMRPGGPPRSLAPAGIRLLYNPQLPPPQ